VSFPTLGIPRVIDPVGLSEPAPARPLVIHAPTHPAAKGTAVIRATIERLRAAGHELDYEELQGVSNAVLRERLSRCSFVVDQVWADTPMAGLAADAALYGKPAVVSGYPWAELRRFIPAAAYPPSELCDPDGLEGAILHLLTDDRHRVELGARARAFVEQRWNAAAVAGRFLELLSARAPAEWVCDPADLRYLLGWGQPTERSLEIVRAVVAYGGAPALGLGDKPCAEAELLALAAGDEPAGVALQAA
jgi:hypothetical protein